MAFAAQLTSSPTLHKAVRSCHYLEIDKLTLVEPNTYVALCVIPGDDNFRYFVWLISRNPQDTLEMFQT